MGFIIMENIETSGFFFGLKCALRNVEVEIRFVVILFQIVFRIVKFELEYLHEHWRRMD